MILFYILSHETLNRQTGKTDKHADRQAGRQTNRQTDRQDEQKNERPRNIIII